MNWVRELAIDLEDILRSLRDSRIAELRFYSAAGDLRARASEASSCGFHAEGGFVRNDESSPGSRYGDDIRSGGPESIKRLMLLRSPGVGRWSTGTEWEKDAPIADEGVCIGKIQALLGDEPLLAPCRGKVGKWLVVEGEVVGFNDPLVIWEVI
ncbi:MAG: hypothetical protein SWK76_16325 [Actinomycetota bacterium]|nr:hypothetical protein [Actinomycetota bacterium]